MKKTRMIAALLAVLSLAAITNAQSEIQTGTVIPVALNSSISTGDKPGKTVSARVMQDIPLPSGAKIRAGSKLVGRVLAVQPGANGNGAEISFTFDKLISGQHSQPVTTDLRAIASFVEVEQAKLPTMGPDRGTPQWEWTTQLIGGDIDYRGGGPVKEGAENIGRPVPDGVLSNLSASSDGPCRSAIDQNTDPQALWVFSADACGVYGFPSMRVAHAGRTNPLGEIVLHSDRKTFKVASGTGMLLRVIRGATGNT